MTQDLRGAVELLDGALWNGLLEPGQALVLKDLKQPPVEKFLARHLADPRLAGIKGKTGKLDKAKVKALFGAWLAVLPARLDERVGRGEVLAFELPARKPVRGYVLTKAGGDAVRVRALEAEVAARRGALEVAVAELERQTLALRNVVARLAPRADAVADAPGLVDAMSEAYRRLDVSGRGYVPIHRLRAEVRGSREAFDQTLRRLRRELIVDLQVGSPSDYSSDAIEQSLLDNDGTLFLTLSWRR